MVYNPAQVRTWALTSDNSGIVLDDEFERIYENVSLLVDGITKTADYVITNGDKKSMIRGSNALTKVTGKAFSVADPTVITSAAHGLVSGDKIVVSNSSAEEEVLNGIYTVTLIGAGTFSIPVDNTAGAGGTLDYRPSILVTLPAAAANTDREVRVMKTDADEGAIVVTDGSTEYDLTTQNQMVELKSDGTNWLELTQRDVGKRSYLFWRHQVAHTTDAGGFTFGDWRTRPMNILTDPDGIAKEDSNQLTLPIGTYEFWGSAPAYEVNHHECRLQNITAGTTLQVGSSEQAPAGSDVTTRSVIHGTFTLTEQSDIEFQHKCETTQAVDGMGQAASLGTLEGYAFMTLYKVA